MTTKNKIHSDITKQLDAQGLSYEILAPTDIKSIEANWRAQFIGKSTAPHLENYKWHIFSYHPDKCFQGDKATSEYKSQFPTDIYIFDERLLYGIKCLKGSKIPDITMDNFIDDIYVCQKNMKWTYVIPHEIADIGPFFCK